MKVSGVIGSGVILAALGCGPVEPEDAVSPAETGETEQSLFNGNKYLTANLPGTGVVRISSQTEPNSRFSQCTGVLLSNRWVLTADHCFCAVHVTNPGLVQVSVFGYDAESEAPQLAELYKTKAVQVVRHPTVDAALVKLELTLPFSMPPIIYTGNGSDLVGQTATFWGYGNNSAPFGIEIGAGTFLSWADMTITFGNDSVAGQNFHECGSGPSELIKLTTGPLTPRGTGQAPRAAHGDSGGPLFLGNDWSTRKLVGILHGSGSKNGASVESFTGMPAIRTWIRQNTPDVTSRSACVTTLPSSSSTKSATLAEGPDGLGHVVAVQSDGSIGHWKLYLGTATKVGTVPGASANTGDAPGLGIESSAASGQPLKMGMAYRDRTTGKLKYTRWSASGGWLSTPIDSGITTAAGPAIAKGGPIALLNSSKELVITNFNPTTSQFSSLTKLSPGAPLADPTKRISIVYEPAFVLTTVGYRTTTGKWVQSTGSLSCPTYFCSWNTFSNSWKSAMLAYAPGQRTSIVTTAIPPGFTSIMQENRALFGVGGYHWGNNRHVVIDQPGVSQFGNDMWLVTQASNTLKVMKADNCFANDF